jgi:glycosyltransferase involved in cell wall biosynthesis
VYLIEASNARHSGALTDYLGLLPALDAMAGDDPIRVLVSPELAAALDGRVDTLELEVLSTGSGLARPLALTLALRRRITALGPRAVAFGQQVPPWISTPYVLRMTDSHMVQPGPRRRLMRFYSPLQRLAWSVRVRAFQRAVRSATRVLCATAAARDELLAAHPELEVDRVRVARFGRSPLARSDARHPGPSGRRLLTMHLRPRKNVELILDALALPGMEAFELSVLGDLDRPVDRYTRFLAERARERGVMDRVHSLGYLPDPDRVLDAVLEHDVLLCPSRIESWSHTVVEGLAVGIPVVASDIACHREVSDGAAWLVGDDAAALARAVREAVAGGLAVRERVERGIAVARRYDWSEHAAALLDGLRAAGAE